MDDILKEKRLELKEKHQKELDAYKAENDKARQKAKEEFTDKVYCQQAPLVKVNPSML